MKVKVNPGWQLGLPDNPKLYFDGDTFDAPDVLAEEWIAGGQAVAVKAEKAPKAVQAAENKAVTSSANKTFTSLPKASNK